jgi:hypothetical protein
MRVAPTNPFEMPRSSIAKFDLVINLKTAKTLGLAIPPTSRRGERVARRLRAARWGEGMNRRSLTAPPSPQRKRGG